MDEKKLRNITGDVAREIEKLHFSSVAFGGYDKEGVLDNLQSVCNIYEQYISLLKQSNEDVRRVWLEAVDDLQKQCCELQQKNRQYSTEPSPPDNSRSSEELMQLMITAKRAAAIIISDAGYEADRIRKKAIEESQNYLRSIQKQSGDIDRI